MALEPQVGEKFSIDHEEYNFVNIDGIPNIVYAEIGRKAKIFKLLETHSNKYKALKVFFPEERSPEKDTNILLSTNKLNQLFTQNFNTYNEKYESGLSVANRKIITSANNPDLIRNYPNFDHSIFMEWIDGESWVNYLSNQVKISNKLSNQLANSFCKVITGLEKRGLAHCDLSPGNFLFNQDGHVELVDIEDLYYHEFTPPDPIPAGTKGYVPEWVLRQGLWEKGADRIAGAILICEILCWRYDEVCQIRHDSSYFANGEIGRITKRYKLMNTLLSEINLEFAKLFERVWFANTVNEAPPLSLWSYVLQSLIDEDNLVLCKNCLNQIMLDTNNCSYCGEQINKEKVQVETDHETPILMFDIESLNFEIKDKEFPVINLKIINEGLGRLTGYFESEPWLLLSERKFDIPAKGSINLSVSLTKNYPHIDSGETYWFPKGIIIHSNAGDKVLGGCLSRPSRRKFFSW